MTRHRRGRGQRPQIDVQVQRSSVCMGDDMDAPHAYAFTIDQDATLRDVLRHIAEHAYLPNVGGKNHSWSVWVGNEQVGTILGNSQYPVSSKRLDEPALRHATGGVLKIDYGYESAPD